MNRMGNLIKKVYKHPAVVLVTILAITVFFALQLVRIRFDNNNFRFIPDTDSARVSTEKIAEDFGDDVPVLIGIQRKFSYVIDKDFIAALKNFDDELKKIDAIKNSVLLTNTKHIDVDNDGIVTELLIPENFSGSDDEIKTIERKLKSWDMYSRSLVSDDLRATQILVFLDVTNADSGSPRAINACRKIIELTDNWEFPDSEIYITGVPIFNEIVNEATAHDLTFLIPIVISVVILILFFSFRRFSGVFLPLLTVIVSVIWALGAMALFSVPLSILSTILPVILIAVGSAYGIHVINHYYDEVTQSDTITKEEHKMQVLSALNEVIRPVFLAAITTFAGFVSFCFTSVVPIFEFGIFASFGVASAFFISVTLIPSILILRGPKKPVLRRRKEVSNSVNNLDKQISKTFVLITERSRTLILFTGILIVFSVLGLKKLVIDNVLMEYFDDDVNVIKSDVFMREQFGGSKLLSMHISVNEGETVLRPDILKAVDDLALFLEREVPETGKVTSITNLIKRINQVYNADASPEGLGEFFLRSHISNNDFSYDDSFGDFGFDDFDENDYIEVEQYNKKPDPKLYTQQEIMDMLHMSIAECKAGNASIEDVADNFSRYVNYHGMTYYEIPFIPEKYGKKTQEELVGVIENYLTLLGKSAEGFLNNTFAPTALKINIQLKTIGQQDSDKVINEIKKFIEYKFPKDIHVEMGGFAAIEKSLNNLVVESQLISVAVSLGIVFLILSLYYKSLIAGLIGIIPLSISILINFGVMGFLGIKLNIGTAMVASFAIGIGVDYTIHFLAAYHKCLSACGGREEFLYSAFLGSGKAILFNAASVGAGFAVLMFSKFNMLAELGLLIALIMLTSSLGSLTILPILLNLIKPKFIRKKYLK